MKLECRVASPLRRDNGILSVDVEVWGEGKMRKRFTLTAPDNIPEASLPGIIRDACTKKMEETLFDLYGTIDGIATAFYQAGVAIWV